MDDKPSNFALFLAKDAAYRERKRAEWKALQGTNLVFAKALKEESEAEEKRQSQLSDEERKSEAEAVRLQRLEEDRKSLKSFEDYLARENRLDASRRTAANENRSVDSKNRPAERLIKRTDGRSL